MEKKEGSLRGKVVLATVKGDVHDIGKNLVDIILTNNGFEVVNLGIKVPSEQLIQAVREHKPNVLGLSGLLVKSAQQMVATAADLKAVGIDVDLLVGGAALSRRFTHRKIAAAYGGLCTYAKDAMTGLKLVESLTNPEARKQLQVDVEKLIAEDRAGEDGSGVESPLPAARASRRCVATSRRRRRPTSMRHVARARPRRGLGADQPADALRQAPRPARLGQEAPGRGRRALPQARARARRGEGAGAIELRVARGVAVLPDPIARRARHLYGDNGQGELGSWVFPRQATGDRLCLADFVLPEDHIALFVTTAGDAPRQLSLRWKEEGDYLKSHALASLALETAEAAAEWLHRKLRAEWGFPDPPEISDQEIFSARYHGRRYSFGYPACPDLAGQRLLFELLQPADIGVTLTEGDMMDPEASVSAIVVHHPEARYFGA